MNINELPEEILVRILSFLPQSDRLESALTCRRWAQSVARAPPLLRDTWLIIKEYRKKEAETVFVNSHRHYENLRFHGVSLLDYNAAFWTSVGATLRKLELIECHHSPEVFHSILQACSNLESLKICNIDVEFIQLSELPPGRNPESIQESMCNLRHLHLEFLVNADILEHFFILMPNVSSIALTRFDEKSDFLSRLPNMLGLSRRITMLDLDRDLCIDDREQLLRISSSSLRTLRYCGDISAQTVLDALRNCSMLRDLDLRLPFLNDTLLLQSILRNVPDLESLSIHNEPLQRVFRREDLMPIFDLGKLRKLYLNFDFVIDSDTDVLDEIVRDLSRMISLESLTLGDGLGFVDSTRFRILASMPNLRELELQSVLWDSQSLRIIISNLLKLRTLSIWGSDVTRQRLVSCDRYSEPERNISTPRDRFKSDRQGEQVFSSLDALKMHNIPLTDACLSHITARHNRLRIFHLWDGSDITDAGLVTLFQHEPLLEELEVSFMYTLDGTFLERLGELCRRLRSLRVRYCKKVSSHACAGFMLRKPGVDCWFNL